MKILYRILFSAVVCAVILSMSGCSQSYDATKAETLSEKISAGGDLTQADYNAMIEQYGYALDYLVSTTDSLMLESDLQQRSQLGNRLRLDPEYQQMQRVWSDFGSTLFQARARGLLDQQNLNAYMDLASYSDRYSRNLAAINP